MKVLDTNVLIDFPNIVTKENQDYVISMSVLNEIDSLKLSSNSNVAAKARKAAVYISKNLNNIKFDTRRRSGLVDDQLVELTKELKGTLITNDVALKVKAKVQGIETEGYTWDEEYKGIVYLEDLVSSDEYDNALAALFETGELNIDYKFSTNEFLVAARENENPSIFRYGGDKFKQVIARSFKNNWCGEIKPRNIEQVCLIDLLLNEEIAVVCAKGKFGTGKTVLTHNYAIKRLEEDKIKKIVYVPNNAYTRDSLEVGTLPGYRRMAPII